MIYKTYLLWINDLSGNSRNGFSVLVLTLIENEQSIIDQYLKLLYKLQYLIL